MRVPSAAELAVAAAACGGTLALAAANGGFGPVSWNVGALVAAWVALMALLLGLSRRIGPWSLALLGAIVFLEVWTAVSAAWSDSLPSSFQEAERTLLYVSVVAAVLATGRMASLPALAWGVLATATTVSVWNLVVRPGSTGTGVESRPIGYANSLAILAAIGVLLALGLALARQPVALASLGALVPVLVLADSAGAWAALAAGIVLLAVLVARVPVAAVAAVAAALVVVFAAGAWVRSRGNDRGLYWSVAAQEVSARPGLGSGAGTYGQWWLRLRRTDLQAEDAHSLYVEMLGELGPLGLAAVLAVFALPVAAAVRRRGGPVAAGAAAAVAAYALAAGVDFHWEVPAVTVPPLLLGAGLVAAADGERPLLGRSLRLATGAVVAALAAAAALALAGSAPLVAAGDELSAGEYRAAEVDARHATRWAPWSAEVWLRLGRARLALGDRAGAREAFAHATERDPRNWEAWLELGEASSGELRRRALARAAQLNPRYFRST